jgi:hypothetical protein
LNFDIYKLLLLMYVFIWYLLNLYQHWNTIFSVQWS